MSIIYTLEKILTIKDNYRSQGYPKPIELIKKGIPFVKTADFNNGYVFNTKEKISLEKFNKLPLKGKIYKDSLLISSYGTIDIALYKLNIGQMSSGIKELVPNKKILLKKYLFYWMLKNIKNIGTISSVFKQLTINEINKIKINLPDLKIQKSIIGIIERNEKLFLKYSNCVRIDTLKNVQSDMKNLIGIIEPIENLENKLINIKNKLIELLINLYNYSNNNQISFNSVIKILISKYENQINYFATNAVGEMQIDYEKIINLSEKNPSRANISPWKDSFIFSKLAGENKIFYFKDKPKEVFSTGFFNFKTKHHDHILGFMLSNDFKKQKECLATGTTMQGINTSSLELIKLNKPNLKSRIIANTLYDLENNLIKIKKLRTKLINFLLK